MVSSTVRRLRLAIAAFVALVVLAANPSAAQAASGGGCGAWDPLDACISQSGSSIAADFYMNVNPDFSRCIAVLGIWKNGSFVQQQTYSLTGKGRYGPIWTNVYSDPPSGSYQAFARVNIYTCDWQFHYYVDSPKLYGP